MNATAKRDRSSADPHPTPAGASDADKIVAAEIRAELARQQITQATLAGHLGVSRPYLTRRLKGDTPLSVGDVAAIADYLDVPVANFTAPVDDERGDR